MPAVGKITLDIKEYEALLARVQKNTAAAANKMSSSVGEIGKGAGKASSALGALGEAAGSAGGQIGKLGRVLSTFSAGWLSVLIAAIGFIISQIQNLWDHATLSAEEYALKVEQAAERSGKAWDKQEKQHSEDKGYMNRLIELSKKEQLSNSAKVEAAQLISILSARYGDLGISIDQVGNKLVGADKALQRFLERQRQQKIEILQTKMDNNLSKISLEAKNAVKAHIGDDTKGRWATLGMSALYTHGIDLYDRVGDYVRYNEDLDAQIKQFSKYRDLAKTEDAIKGYQNVIDLLEQQKEMSIQMRNLKNFGVATESEAEKTLREQTEKDQKKSDFTVEQMHEAMYQANLNAGKLKEAAIIKTINDLKKQGIELTIKEAEAVTKAQRVWQGNEKYRKDKTGLEDQVHLQQLMVQGKKAEARQWEIIYSYIHSGMATNSDNVDKLLELQDKLGSLKLQKERQDQGKSLYEQALRASGRAEEADRYRALEHARETKGGELTSSEQKATLRMVNLTRRLEHLAKLDFGRSSIQANALTARGGGGGKVIGDHNQQIQRTIAQRAAKTNDLLRDIKREIRHSSKISGDPSH